MKSCFSITRHSYECVPLETFHFVQVQQANLLFGRVFATTTLFSGLLDLQKNPFLFGLVLILLHMETRITGEPLCECDLPDLGYRLKTCHKNSGFSGQFSFRPLPYFPTTSCSAWQNELRVQLLTRCLCFTHEFFWPAVRGRSDSSCRTNNSLKMFVFKLLWHRLGVVADHGLCMCQSLQINGYLLGLHTPKSNILFRQTSVSDQSTLLT